VPELLKEGELFLEKYRIERLIGQGGMGAVFAAVNEALAKRVAIKVLLPEVASSKEAANRFINEARASDRITGDHVARVFDVGQTREGLSYMVLEYLDGQDVSQLLEARGGAALPIPDAVDIVLEALEGIAEAHSLGIVHRDLKPGNLFLARKSNGTQIVKVLDFGISKATNPFALGNSDHALTSTKSMLGSPLYMSPEQLRSSKSVDQRSDLWAMGVILYEMLSGVVPFNGESLGELFVAILEQPAVPLGHRRPEVPPQLVAVVHRCLERDPAKRVANAGELAQLLAPFASRAMSSVERIRSFSRSGNGSTVALAAAPPRPFTPGADASGSFSGSGSAVPVGAAISGSGVHAMPPMNAHAQTNQTWAETGGVKPSNKSIIGLVIGGGAFLAVAFVGVVAAVLHFGGKKADHPPVGADPLAVSSVVATPPPPPPTAPAVDTTVTAQPVATQAPPVVDTADAGTKVSSHTSSSHTSSSGTTKAGTSGSTKHGTTPSAPPPTTGAPPPVTAKPPPPDDVLRGR
jgi:serine/threonine protein kinase